MRFEDIVRNIFQLTPNKKIEDISVDDLGDIILCAIFESGALSFRQDSIVNGDLIRTELQRSGNKEPGEFDFTTVNKITFKMAEAFQGLINAGVIIPHPPVICDGALTKRGFEGFYFVSNNGHLRHDKVRSRVGG